MTDSARSWAFIAAAAVPCLAALLFFVVGAHEWWLISTNQIAVIPAPRPGQAAESVEVSASSLLPLVLGSGALAATFGYALLRRSRRVLVAGYAIVAVIAGLAFFSRV